MDFDAIDDASCDAIGDARKLDGMVNKAFMESSDNDEFGTDRYFFGLSIHFKGQGTLQIPRDACVTSRSLLTARQASGGRQREKPEAAAATAPGEAAAAAAVATPNSHPRRI